MAVPAGDATDAAAGRAQREAAFHDARYADDPRRSTSKYYGASAGRAWFRARAGELATRADVLDLGCGTGAFAVDLAPHAVSVTGVDISAVALARGRRRARTARVHNTAFVAADACRLAFPDERFDVVVGSGVLHHVGVAASCREAARVLRPGGRALFIEPLGNNPIINAYRRATPHLRSVDEEPLRRHDLETASDSFASISLRYFDCVSLVPSIVRPLRRWQTWFDRADAQLFERFARASALAWVVVIEAAKAY